ncbi:MAG: T9SS type A sorting domain-containing protein [candidate division WOR-3 bacterium]
MRFGIIGLVIFASIVMADVLLSENFDSPWSVNNPPPGWTIYHTNIPPDTLNDDWHREQAGVFPWVGHPTPYAAIWWDVQMDSTPDMLISPMIDCRTFRNITLKCSTYFRHKQSSYTAEIRYSTDGGITFPYLLRNYQSQNVGPGVQESLVLTNAALKESVVVAWIFNGNLGDIHWWCLDDVVLTGDSVYSWDIQCRRIIAPLYYVQPGLLNPQARFRNVGLNDQFDIPVFCALFDSALNPIQSWADTIDTLLAFTGEKVKFFDPPCTLGVGRYYIQFWCLADSDYNRANDTLDRWFTVSYLQELSHDDGTAAGNCAWPVGHYGWGAKFTINAPTPVYIESIRTCLRTPTNPSFCQYQVAVALDDGTGQPGPLIFKTPVLQASPGTVGWHSVFLADTQDFIMLPPGDFYVFYLQKGEPPECPQLCYDGGLDYPNNYWEWRNGSCQPVTPSGDFMIRVMVNSGPVVQAQNDIRTRFVELPLYEFVQRPYNAPCPLRACIDNFGLVPNDVAVTCSILGAGNALRYVGVASVGQLQPGAMTTVVFSPEWIPQEAEPCSIIVHAEIVGGVTPPEDSFPQNNDKRFTCEIIKGSHTGSSAGNYAWMDSDTMNGPVFNWVNPDSDQVAISIGDDARIYVPLYFNFPYYDTSYNFCYVSTNGWLALGSDPGTNAPVNDTLPNTNPPNRMIAPWWDNLAVGPGYGGGRVYYQTEGEEPNRRFVVTWSNVNRVGTDTSDLLTFQCILNENGTIVFQYADVTTGDLEFDNGRRSSIGLDNKTGTDGLNYLYAVPPMSRARNDLANRLAPGRAVKLFRQFRDAAALAITVPENYVFPGTVYPQVRVQNYGTVGDTFWVFLAVRPAGYFDSLLVYDLLPGAETTLFFPGLNLTRGTYTAVCSTAMTGDVNPANDVCSKTIICSPWVQRTDIPLGLYRRKVKNASLVYAPVTGKLYALKGGNTNEFWSYDIATGVWDSLASMPLEPSGTRAKDGCDLAYDGFNNGGQGQIWAIKGGGRTDFYSYDIPSNTWTMRRPPLVGGQILRVPKKGASIVYVPGYGAEGAVYMVPGNNTLYFLRYDIAGDSWSRLQDVPFKPENKKTCRYGTDMVYDGRDFIYLSKGSNTAEVYKYTWAEDSWYSRPLDETHLSDLTGRRKRVKAGGSLAWLDSSLYLLKGGNTQEFWSHTVGGGDTWVRRADIPISITGRRTKVKRGSAMVGVPQTGTIFCLKGSYGFEFWEYKPSTDSVSMLFSEQPVRQGVMAGQSQTARPGIHIFPNLVTDGQAQLYYNLPETKPALVRIFDVTGRVVLERSMVLARQGSLPLDLSNLTPGVYLVRLETPGYRATRKLIIGH